MREKPFGGLGFGDPVKGEKREKREARTSYLLYTGKLFMSTPD